LYSPGIVKIIGNGNGSSNLIGECEASPLFYPLKLETNLTDEEEATGEYMAWINCKSKRKPRNILSLV